MPCYLHTDYLLPHLSLPPAHHLPTWDSGTTFTMPAQTSPVTTVLSLPICRLPHPIQVRSPAIPHLCSLGLISFYTPAIPHCLPPYTIVPLLPHTYLTFLLLCPTLQALTHHHHTHHLHLHYTILLPSFYAALLSHHNTVLGPLLLPPAFRGSLPCHPAALRAVSRCRSRARQVRRSCLRCRSTFTLPPPAAHAVAAHGLVHTPAARQHLLFGFSSCCLRVHTTMPHATGLYCCYTFLYGRDSALLLARLRATPVCGSPLYLAAATHCARAVPHILQTLLLPRSACCRACYALPPRSCSFHRFATTGSAVLGRTCEHARILPYAATVDIPRAYFFTFARFAVLTRSS